MENQVSGIAEEFLSPQERTRLVALCRKLTGNQDIAEDLVQETLFLAWRHMQQLRMQEKRFQWIAGIARNVSLRWLRQYGREQARHFDWPHNDDKQDATTLEELIADEFDLEIELERRELVNLLDRALALLPAETRSVLIKRYIEESPLADIAEQLGANTGTIAMRLQRGKLALRKVLTSDMQQEILAYRMAAATQGWEATSLWCNLCGMHRLLGKKQPEIGLLYLKCPSCSPGDEVLSKSEGLSALRDIKTFRPAYARLGEWCHGYYRQALRDGSILCAMCGRRNITKLRQPEEIRELLWLNRDSPKWVWRQGERLVSVVCSHCQSINCISLEGLIISLPEGRRFLRAHPRIHQLPYLTSEFAGRPSIVTRFESMTDHASFEVISDYETYEVLKIYGGDQ